MNPDLAWLGALYAQLSLLAVGGVVTVLPEMQRAVVEVRGWMAPAEFAALFALAQAAPGPNMMVATLVGWRVAGLPGALVATLGMIGGQYLDITGTAPDGATLHKLKTGCLFAASVGLALWVARIPESEQRPWRAFGDELGLLFQIVDDILDGDGYVVTHGVDGARRLADEAAEHARARLAEVDADTSVLREIVDGLAVRTA